HLAFAAIASAVTARAACQPWLLTSSGDTASAGAVCLGLPTLVLAGSLFAIALARSAGAGRALAIDAVSFAAVILLLGLVSFDAPGRDLVGVTFVLAPVAP